MSTSSTKYCGTSGGLGPLPSDPDSNLILTVKPAFGGIDVLWTWPEINGHAVAYTIIYRSTNADFATAVAHHRSSSDFYYDRVNPEQNIEYFYWVRWISINGTEGELIGPASAVARPTVEQTIEMLTGQITAGVLAQSLKEELQRIDGLNSDLGSEIAARLAQYDAIQADLAQFQNDVTGLATIIANDVQRLEDADTAQINQINVLGAKTDSTEAMIIQESKTRADADSALAQTIETLQASSANKFYQDTPPDPAVVTLQEDDIWVDTTEPADGAEPQYPLYQWDGAQWVLQDPNTLAGLHAAIEAEKMARVTRDGALAQRTDTLEASVGRKSRTYFQANPPALPENIGDLWIDTDDKNRLYRWDGSSWVDASASTGIQVFRQSTAPLAENVGDLWFDDDDDDRGYRWDGSIWQPLNLMTGNQVSAAIEEYDTARVGFCMINDSPDATKENRDACVAAGGTWLNMYAIAEVVKGVHITDGQNGTASIQQRMVTYKDDLDALNAEYTVKVQTDSATGEKIVGGFGIATDTGTGTVEAGFDVDRFWVGKLGNKKYPFIIEGQEVFIDEAVINELTFSKLRDESGSVVVNNGKLSADHIDVDNLVAQQAQSPNFVPGSSGWQLTKSGGFEANNATFRGHVEMDTGHISETVQIGGTVASTVRDNASTARSRVDQWVKPGFTWIDGTQIYTGDAYVDTLQIKGQAVTFPRGTTNAGTLTLPNGAYHSVLSLYAAHTGAPIIVTVSINFPSRAQIYNSRETLSAVVKRGDTTLYGPVSLRSSVLDGTEAAFTPGVFGFSFYLPTSASGTYTVQLSGSSSTSVEISTRSITILEAKR